MFIEINNLVVYVINLDRSPDRLSDMARQLELLGMPYRRVTAIDGSNATTEQKALIDVERYIKLHGKTPLPGELGCYLSHYLAIETFEKAPEEFALILEDDAILSSCLTQTERGLLADPQSWDMAKFSGVHSGTPIVTRHISASCNLCVMLTKCTGSSAYLINKKAANSYVNKLLPMCLPIDHEIDKGWDYGIKVRAVIPFPVTHNTQAHSTIGEPPISRKLPAHRRFSTYWYRLKTELRRVIYGVISVLHDKFGTHKKTVES